MYSQYLTVRYSETQNSTLTIADLVDYFQDVCTQQGEEAGYGHEYLSEHTQGWVVTVYSLKIHRLPQICEKVRVDTIPYSIRGMLGNRAFALYDEKGELLATADTLWVFMDLDKQRPARVPEEIIEAYNMGDKPDITYRPTKLSVKENRQLLDTFTVPVMFIDTNHHMNHTYYVDLASRYIPDGFVVSEMTVNFKESAVLGNQINISRAEIDGGVQIVLEHENKPYAIVEFIGETN